jgi:hypothetical protein
MDEPKEMSETLKKTLEVMVKEYKEAYTKIALDWKADIERLEAEEKNETENRNNCQPSQE